MRLPHLLIAVLCLLAGTAHAQIIFQETFDEGNGATSGNDDVGGVVWNASCPGCVAGDFFEIVGGELVAEDSNGPADWTTGTINTSSCNNVEVSIDISEIGTMEACGTGCNSVDWVQLEYNVDGTGWVTPSNSFFCAGACAGLDVIIADDITGGSTTYTTCITTGATLELRVTVQCWAQSEQWIIDNVTVSCSGPGITASTVTNPSCAGACDGQIDITVGGGTPPYTYQWFDGTMTPIGPNASTITGLCADNYSVQVSDAGGGTVTFFTEDFGTGCSQNNPAAGTVTANGTWTVTDVGAVDPSPSNIFFISATEAGMGNGNCGDGCLANAALTDRTLHIGNQAGTPASGLFCPTGDCGAAYDAAVSASVRAESPVINCTGQSTISLTLDYIHMGEAGLDFGSIWYFDGATWSVLQNPIPQVQCCFIIPGPDGVCDGLFYAQGRWDQITVALPASADNNPNVQIGIQWENDNGNTGTDPSLAVDNIQLSSVGSSCPTTGNFTLTDPPAITIDITSLTITDETCGLINGSITGITASGGTGALSYDWNGNGTLGPDTLGLAAGSYTLTVTDANGCSATSGPHVVNNTPGPVLDITGLTIVDENCGQADGSITGMTVSGGTLPYSYDWSGNNASGTDTLNIGAGSYTLTVTDAAGCTATSGPHVINNNPGPTIDITGLTITDENCNMANGSISGITVSGGTMPYSYDWSGNGTLGADTVNIGSGSYTLTVTDAAGCTASSGPHVVNNIPGPTIDITGLTITGENCGGVDGSITGITVSGGTMPYSYDWSGNATVGADTVNIGAGTYTLTVTDAAGCTATSGPHNVPSIGGPTLDITGLTITDENCNMADGSISGITVSGGTLPYSYDWSGNSASGPDTLNIGAGSYTLTVTDGAGCTITSGPHVVNNNPGPTLDVTGLTIVDENCGQADGSITGITVSGGTMPYTYDWSGNNASGPDTLNIGAGSYTLTVTDAAGCTATSGPHVINNTGGPTIDITGLVIADENCSQADGSITGITVSGGTMPYSYDWSGNATAGADTVNIGAGSYTLTVTDAAGCTASSGPHVVNNNPGPVIDITAMVITDENCGAADGSITGITVSGGTMPYTYDWNGNTTIGADTVGLGVGNYTLTVTDVNGCSATSGPHTVNSIGGPVISSITLVDPLCNGSTDGSIDINLSSGVGPLQFSIDNGTNFQSDSLFTGQGSGTYDVIVEDANGCQTITQVTLTDPPQLTVTASGAATICDGDSTVLGAVEGGGTGVVTYAWTPAGSLDDPTIGNPTASPTTTTMYYITVTDANGCTALDSVQVIVNPIPVVDAGANVTITAGSSTQLTATPTGAASYVWTPPGSLDDPTIENPVASPSVTTTYYVTITVGGCSATDSVTVTVDALQPIVIPTVITPDGDGFNDTWIIDNINLYPNNVVTIFNRWGNEIFYSQGYNTQWDGTFNGNALPTGSYYFVIELNDGVTSPYTGYVSIIR